MVSSVIVAVKVTVCVKLELFKLIESLLTEKDEIVGGVVSATTVAATLIVKLIELWEVRLAELVA